MRLEVERAVKGGGLEPLAEMSKPHTFLKHKLPNPFSSKP